MSSSNKQGGNVSVNSSFFCLLFYLASKKLNIAHLHWGRQSTLLSPAIHTLALLGNNFTKHPEVTLNLDTPWHRQINNTKLTPHV
jgi:hypothetical protein